MKVKCLTAAAAMLALAASASAAKTPAPKPSCFWSQNVTNFAASNETAVNVRVGVHDVYQLELLTPCRDVDFNTAIAIVPRGSSQICTGFDAELVSHSPIGPQRCQIKTMRKLTPAEVAALPKRARP